LTGSDSLANRLRLVRERISKAAQACSRDPAEITLVAVGKTHGAQVVAAAVDAGAADLGENRVQEALDKKPHVPAARWHLIGPLQRNKVRKALDVFDIVHTLDREGLAARLQRLLAEHWPGRVLPVLLEVNIGDEDQKAGVRAHQARHLLDAALACPQLEVVGLMAIPPYAPDPEASRPSFIALRHLRDRLSDDAGVSLPQLSMGMSHDFEVAVTEGSTMVRVGTAIFGPRAPRTK